MFTFQLDGTIMTIAPADDLMRRSLAAELAVHTLGEEEARNFYIDQDVQDAAFAAFDKLNGSREFQQYLNSVYHQGRVKGLEQVATAFENKSNLLGLVRVHTVVATLRELASILSRRHTA